MSKKIQELAMHDKDTGSSEIQIAFLTDKIETLSNHIKKFKKDKNRLEKFKRLLVDLDIKFDDGDWQTIDRNCERRKQEKKATRH